MLPGKYFIDRILPSLCNLFYLGQNMMYPGLILNSYVAKDGLELLILLSPQCL